MCTITNNILVVTRLLSAKSVDMTKALSGGANVTVIAPYGVLLRYLSVHTAYYSSTRYINADLTTSVTSTLHTRILNSLRTPHCYSGFGEVILQYVKHRN